MQCRMGCGSSKEAPPAGTAVAEQRTRTQDADAVMNATIEAAAKIIQDAKRDAAEIAAAATTQAEQAATARKEVEDEYDSVLASHIATILGLKEMSVSQYVSVLREEGFDAPDDFDSLAVDELKEEPFNWKRGHILKLLHDAVTAFNYEEHAPIAIGLYSCVTPAIFGSGQWLLSMHYGRVHDAIKLLDDNLHHTEKLVANPAAGFVHSFMWSAGSLATVYTIHGMSQHVAKHYSMLGLSFDTAEERVSEVTGPDAMFQPIDAVGPDKDGIIAVVTAATTATAAAAPAAATRGMSSKHGVGGRGGGGGGRGVSGGGSARSDGGAGAVASKASHAGASYSARGAAGMSSIGSGGSGGSVPTSRSADGGGGDAASAASSTRSKSPREHVLATILEAQDASSSTKRTTTRVPPRGGGGGGGGGRGGGGGDGGGAASTSKYGTAVAQIRKGKKTGHWIWYIWPTLRQLRPGTSKPQF
eukprot:gene3834-26860_t